VTLTLSPPVRIAAICGLLLTVVAFGGLKLMGGSGSESSVATPHIIKHHPFGPGAKTTHKPTPAAPQAAAKSHKTSTTATPAKTKTVAKKTAPVEAKPVVDHAAVAAALKAGLPAPVAEAFGVHDTVVVSLYDPYSQVDGISFAEAKAGAALSGVGFVPLNVLSQAQVGKLTEQLGLLPDPGLLVYVRPGRLVVKIGGFADKETVAQAAQDAARST
jgi:hypothetical protein